LTSVPVFSDLTNGRFSPPGGAADKPFEGVASLIRAP
jgi:hypothetical protein